MKNGNILEPLLSAREVEVLDKILEEIRPKISVEVGSWMGGGSRIIANRSEKLFCVDHWSGCIDAGVKVLSSEEWLTVFCINVGEYLFTKVFPCRGLSTTWSKILNFDIDFLFIDGDHSYKGVSEDIEGWVPRVKRGGLVVGHDHDQPDVERAVRDHLCSYDVISGTTFWTYQRT